MSLANRPPQHFFFCFLSVITPYFLHLSNLSLINILNKIGDKGYPWRTPRYTGNSFESLSLKI